jgi:hypothetical protein
VPSWIFLSCRSKEKNSNEFVQEWDMVATMCRNISMFVGLRSVKIETCCLNLTFRIISVLFNLRSIRIETCCFSVSVRRERDKLGNHTHLLLNSRTLTVQFLIVIVSFIFRVCSSISQEMRSFLFSIKEDYWNGEFWIFNITFSFQSFQF